MRHYEDQNKNVVGDYEQNLNYRRPKVDEQWSQKRSYYASSKLQM